MARLTTVFGIGIAALASCQPFRDSAHSTDAAIEAGVGVGATGEPWPE